MKLHLINTEINFFVHQKYFWPIVAFANLWKETGWNAIIYLAAITAIDPCLYEAASIDGAGRWAKIRYITLPGIKSTIMILLLMNVGNVLNAGFEVQYLLGNGLVQNVSQTIDIGRQFPTALILPFNPNSPMIQMSSNLLSSINFRHPKKSI